MARLMTDDERITLAGLRPKFVHPAIGAAADAAAALPVPSFRTYLTMTCCMESIMLGQRP